MDRKDVEVMTCCCKGNEDGNVKHKQRDEQEKKALMTRLSRIEGQVRGIRAMVEDDRYCVDILTQVSAIQAALNGFNKDLFRLLIPCGEKCGKAYRGGKCQRESADKQYAGRI